MAYALVSGSRARGTARPESDLDLAIGVTAPFDHRDLGDLIARIEAATGHTVDLVLLDEAPPGLAYRMFRDGLVVLERDRGAMVRRKARAILEYFDFKPFEDILARGSLEAAERGR